MPDVGISMGSKSTDIAIETSDVVIGRDDPMMIAELRRLSVRAMDIVHQNFALVIGINSVGLILGAASNISVMFSSILHNTSTNYGRRQFIAFAFCRFEGMRVGKNIF